MDGDASIVRKLAELNAESHRASVDNNAPTIMHDSAAALARHLSRRRLHFIESGV